jgi:hypothetical protein
MRKTFFQAIYIVLMGLFIYSCSELILPKQVAVKGTVNLPARIGTAKLSSMLAKKIDDAFSVDAGDGTRVYNVDYRGQTVQTFCIYLPIEITEDLNPDDFLKTIDRQINAGIDAEPKKIDVSIPYPGPFIPIADIEIIDTIPSVSLAEIAQYVITIDFDACKEDGELAGIGINFHFTEIPDGLKMILECDELKFSSDAKPLKTGDNIFGNEDDLTLALEEYKNNNKQLNFDITLLSDGPIPGMLDLSGSGLVLGDTIRIEGEMRFFYVWKEAKIDLASAIKASAKQDNLTGKFPKTAFDLSGLNDYLDGGFTFNNLEARLYISGPSYDSINDLEAKLILSAQYDSRNEELYNSVLFIDSRSTNIDDYLDENENYKVQHLPGPSSAHNGEIKDETIANMFKAMPNELYFLYKIDVSEALIIRNSSANGTGNSGDGSKITTTMMIMLPISLTATGNGGEKSTISLPDMFGKGELFGREEPEDLFDAADIDYIRMIIDISDQIFTNGYLFINKDKDLFPDGVRLNSKKIMLNFTNREVEEVRQKLIFPDIKIEIDNDETINVPKNMGIVNIRFEMKGLINLGEL